MSLLSSLYLCVEIYKNRDVYPDPLFAGLAHPSESFVRLPSQGAPGSCWGGSSRSSPWATGAERQGGAGSSQAWVHVCQLSLQMLYQNLGNPSCTQKVKRTLHPACTKSTVPGHCWLRAVKDEGNSARYSLNHSLSFALWGHRVNELFRLERTF